MKFKCDCGETISDQTDAIPYKAHFHKDMDDEEYQDGIIKDISKFIDAIMSGKREIWIEENFGAEYPQNLENESIIFDLILNHRIKYESYIYQCEHCGAVFFGLPGKTELECYLPIEDKFKLLFEKK